MLLAFLSWQLLSLATFAAAAQTPYLVVTEVGGEVLLELDLSGEPSWIIRWNHSVTGIVVSDYYSYIEGTMMLTDSHTPAFDAGLGYIAGRGRLESDAHHGYWIYDIDEPVPGNAYYLWVGSARVDHRIVHAGRSYSLSAEAAGKRVLIQVALR